MEERFSGAYEAMPSAASFFVSSQREPPLVECPALKRLVHLRAAFEKPLLEVFDIPVLFLSQLRAAECCLCCEECCCCGLKIRPPPSQAPERTVSAETASAEPAEEDLFCRLLAELNPSVLKEIRAFDDALSAKAQSLSAFAAAKAGKECDSFCFCKRPNGGEARPSNFLSEQGTSAGRGAGGASSSSCEETHPEETLPHRGCPRRGGESLTSIQQFIQVLVAQRLLLSLPTPDSEPRLSRTETFVFACDWLCMVQRRISLHQREALRELRAVARRAVETKGGEACLRLRAEGKFPAEPFKQTEIFQESRWLLSLPAALRTHLACVFRLPLMGLQSGGCVKESHLLAALQGFLEESLSRRREAATLLGKLLLNAPSLRRAKQVKDAIAHAAPLFTLCEVQVFCSLRANHRRALEKKQSELSSEEVEALRLRHLWLQAESLREMLSPGWKCAEERQLAEGLNTASERRTETGRFCCEASRRLLGVRTPSLCPLCRERRTALADAKSASETLLRLLQTWGVVAAASPKDASSDKALALSFPSRGVLFRWLRDGCEEVRRLLSAKERGEVSLRQFRDFRFQRCGLGHRFLLLHLIGAGKVALARDPTNSLSVLQLR